MSGLSVSRQHYRRECIAAALAVLYATVVLVVRVGGAPVARAVSAAVLVGSPLFAAAAGVQAARRQSGRTRVAWALVASAGAMWAAGSVLDATAREGADWARLGALVAAGAGLLALPSLHRHAGERVRAALDGVLVFGSLVVACWVLALGPAVAVSEATPGDLALSLARPLGACVLLALLSTIVLGWRRRGVGRESLWLVGGGLVVLAVGDSVGAYLEATGAYAAGHVVDVLWLGAWLLVALGARVPVPLVAGAQRAVEGDEAAHTSSAKVALLPYAGILVTVAAAALELWRSGRLSASLVGVGLLLLALGMVRQLLILTDNVRLARELEQRVVTRTAEVRAREDRFRSLVQHSSDVITIVDRDGMVQYASPSLARVFGLQPDQVVGVAFTIQLHPYDLPRFHELLQAATRQPAEPVVAELTVRHVDGTYRTCESTFTSLLHDASVRGVVVNTRDVSERRQLEQRLEHEAFHDRLTGLATRAVFGDRLQRSLASRERRPRPVGVLMLDIDGFKAVNDALGTAAADAVLSAFAERLRAAVRSEDTVARLGGDEFGVLMDEMDDAADAASIAERILATLADPFRVGPDEVRLGATIGISVAEARESVDELLRNADLALHRAKTGRRGGWEHYESGMHAALMLRRGIEQDLRHAVARDELVLHYQPIVELTTGRVVGTEALLRWSHPERGLLAPMKFVPVAEETGLIVEIGRWVLDHACQQGAQWQRRYSQPGAAPLTMAVNLSGRQLQERGLVQYVAVALEQSGMEPESVTLEITESLLLEDDDRTIDMLRALKAMGVRIAIDDFGTGYSSLSYLHRLPVDVLKIDRAFVELLARPRGEEGSELARTVVQLGHSLGLDTVAEGIETDAQLAALKQYGCEVGQGFYFTQPVPAEQLERLLITQSAFGPAGPVRAPGVIHNA